MAKQKTEVKPLTDEEMEARSNDKFYRPPVVEVQEKAPEPEKTVE